MAEASFINYAYDTYGVEIKCRSEMDAASNSSLVTVDVVLHHPAINIGSRAENKIGIDGSIVKYKTGKISNKESTDAPVASYSLVVQHDEDGKKQVDVFATFDYNLTSTRVDAKIRTVTVKGTFELDTIGRTSLILDHTEDVVADGVSEWFVEMEPSSDDFWHKATLQLGTLQLTTNPFKTRFGGVVIKDWLNFMTDTATGTMYVTIQTYSDESCETPVGEPAKTSFLVRVPEDAYPVCYPSWAVAAITNDGTKAENAKFGVQGVSKAKVVFDALLVETKYGASLKGFRVECEGKTYNGDVVDGKGTIETDVLAGSGKVTLNVSAIDSRDIKATYRFTVTVYEYKTPVLNNISVYRCDENGNADGMGKYMYVRADVVYSQCGDLNKLSLFVAWQKRGEGGAFGDYDMTSGVGAIIPDIDEKSSYFVYIIARDMAGGNAHYQTILSSMDASLHIMDGGKGGAFGKFAEMENTLEVAWDLKVIGSIYDKNGDEVLGRGSGAQLIADCIDMMQSVGNNAIASITVCDATAENASSGLYMVSGWIRWASSSGEGTRSVWVYRRGGASSKEYVTNVVPASQGVLPAQNFSAVVPCMQGERITIELAQSSGNDITVLGNYTVVKIGGLALDKEE